MKILLSSLALGLAAAAPALDLNGSSSQEAPKVPQFPATTQPLAPTVSAAPLLAARVAAPALPELVSVPLQSPLPLASTPQDEQRAKLERRIETFLTSQDDKAKAQGDDLAQEAARLEAEVARLREQLAKMRKEMGAGERVRGIARVLDVPAEPVIAEEPVQGARRRSARQRDTAEERSEVIREQARELSARARTRAESRAAEARDRAQDRLMEARELVARVQSENDASARAQRPRRLSGPRGISGEAAAPTERRGRRGAVTEVEEEPATDQGTVRYGINRGSAQGTETKGSKDVQAWAIGTGAAPQGARIFVQDADHGGPVTRTFRGSDGSTFNIHVEDGDVHIHTHGGGAVAPAAPQSVFWSTPKVDGPKVITRIRKGDAPSVGSFFFSNGDDDEDEDDEGEDEDDDERDERFVFGSAWSNDGGDRSTTFKWLSDFDLEDITEGIEVDVFQELADAGLTLGAPENLKGLHVLGDADLGGLIGLGSNAKVQVKVMGRDGQLFELDDLTDLDELFDETNLKATVEGLLEGFEIEIEEEECIEEEPEDADDRFVRAGRSPFEAGLGLNPGPPALGFLFNPAQATGTLAGGVSDSELLELAREIREELRMMRAELDELRREVLGARSL